MKCGPIDELLGTVYGFCSALFRQEPILSTWLGVFSAASYLETLNLPTLASTL